LFYLLEMKYNILRKAKHCKACFFLVMYSRQDPGLKKFTNYGDSNSILNAYFITQLHNKPLQINNAAKISLKNSIHTI